MTENKKTIAFGICGSFCTFEKVFEELKKLSLIYDILPIMSENARTIDTRFGKAEDHVKKVEEITGKKVLSSIVETEPIGPLKLADAMVIAPCTGNTLAKLANAITDNGITMAAKSQLRAKRPVVIALSSNDILGINMENVGRLMATKNIYFVPFKQDDPQQKGNSVMADFTMIDSTIINALLGKQFQPVML